MANKPNRSRGRGRKPGGGNNANRSYESNGPDVKIRGNASHISEKYQQLARDASASGDRIGAENYLQHAEHYYRLVLEAQQQREQRDQQRAAAAEANGNSNADGDTGEGRGDKAEGGREGGNRRRGRRRRDTVQEANSENQDAQEPAQASSPDGSAEPEVPAEQPAGNDTDNEDGSGEAEVIVIKTGASADKSSDGEPDDAVAEPA